VEGAGGPLCECALLALARPLSICLILYIYRERERDRLWLAEFGGGVTRHLALVPSVSPAFFPPVDLNK
jgi:hypothetical protein